MEHMREIPKRPRPLFQAVVEFVRIDKLLEAQRRQIPPFVVGSELIHHHDAIRPVPAIERADQHTTDKSRPARDEKTRLAGKLRSTPATTLRCLLFCRLLCFAHAPSNLTARTSAVQTPSHCHRPATAVTSSP